MPEGFIYILTNKSRTVTYMGVTNNPERRIGEHKFSFGSSFTKRYKLKILVYFERHPTMHDAICREKQLKNWHKQWKNKLVERLNPEWKDLAANWY
jgi:putative endonuclease